MPYITRAQTGTSGELHGKVLAVGGGRGHTGEPFESGRWCVHMQHGREGMEGRVNRGKRRALRRGVGR